MTLFAHKINQEQNELYTCNLTFKGGYLDFSHHPELENIYITEICMKREYKPSTINNHKISNKKKIDGVSLNDYVAS